MSEIEGAPEQVHWARLAEEPSLEDLEDPLDLDECQPEAPSRLAVESDVDAIVGERDGAGNFDRHGPDRGREPELIEQRHHCPVELAHWSILEFECTTGAIDRGDLQ